MRCSRIKQYDDRVIMEEECTHEYFLSSGDLLYDSVVGVTSPRCWAPLLFIMGTTTLTELPCLTVRQSLVKWLVFPQLKHGYPAGVGCFGGLNGVA
jgi:hypothetical protein